MIPINMINPIILKFVLVIFCRFYDVTFTNNIIKTFY